MGWHFGGTWLLTLLAVLHSMGAWADSPATTTTYPALTIALASQLEHAPSAGAPSGDLWARIRAGFRLPDSNPELTRSYERWYQDHDGYLEKAVKRSRIYLFHIAEEVEKRGMPMEIVLLPMIESAYNPMAMSRQKASGMWQFIPSTGKVFGLDQNPWFDGRRDVVESTRAALDYLQKLYQMFGDWELALAAYNCGEGCVQRAQDRGQGTDYTSIRLPKETRNYVPRLVAVRNLIQDPARFGIQLDSLPNESYFMPVNLLRPMEARKAAELAEVSLDEFLALNPAFQRNVIYTESRNVLLLPADHVETFQFNLHRLGLERAYLKTYAAKKGETATSIASRFGVSLDWLKEHNPLKLWHGKVAQAQNLVVPAGTAKAKSVSVEIEKREGATTARTHTVRPGDTLYSLARFYKVKVDDIRRHNPAIEPLKLGAKLNIPAITG